MDLLRSIFDKLDEKYNDKCDTNTCNCSCQRLYEDIDEDIDEDVTEPVIKIEMGNLDPIVAENAVTASELRLRNLECAEFCEDVEGDEVVEPEVKLINVNKNVSKALETIYDVVSEVNDDGETCVTFNLVEEFPELFENVREVTMEKVMNRISRHLSENGFDVETNSEVNEYDNKVEKVYEVTVAW